MSKKMKRTKKAYPKPRWISKTVSGEKELCPECFKVVGVESRYKLVCLLGKEKSGMSVTELTAKLGLRQPTITHHLQTLKSVEAVTSKQKGREQIYSLNREAHCFEECRIPY